MLINIYFALLNYQKKKCIVIVKYCKEHRSDSQLAAQQEYTVERVFLNKYSSQEAIEKIIEIYISNKLKEERLAKEENEKGDL